MKHLSVWFGLLSLLAAAPVSSPVPGGVVTIAVPKPMQGEKMRFMDRRGVVYEKNGKRYAIFPIPLDAKAGRYFIYFENRKRKEKLEAVEIEEKRYAVQHLSVKNRRKVNPAAEDMIRIKKESVRKRRDKAFRTGSMPDVDFVWPVSGEISSPFGLRRFFNGQPRSPHKGIDIVAPEGKTVVAASDGYVVDAGDFFFSGNLVFIEHGQGLMTLYAHLSRIDVEPGERVRKGDKIGLVGKTGRVTGPHLHFSVLIDRVYVDPMLFLDGPKDAKR